MVPHVSLSVSSNVPTIAIASSVPASPMIPPSAPLAPAPMSVSLASSAVCQTFAESVIANHQFSAPDLVAFNSSPWLPEIVFLRMRLARNDAELLELDKIFKAREDHCLELEPCLSIADLTKAMHCSQVVTLQTELSAARADITTARSFVVLVSWTLNAMRTDNE